MISGGGGTTARESGAIRSLGWGAYLACSWTWCIGMFLPALMLRDFGWPGFLVFAVPNVIGAAAMGWFTPGGETQLRLLRDHAGAVRWFSTITIAFHMYWIGMIGSYGVPVWIAGVAILSFAATRFGPGILGRRWLLLPVLVWLISIGLGGFLLSRVGLPAHAMPGEIVDDLAMLLPPVVMGFLLCPYLDGTFHAARQAQSARWARVAFTVGFGVLFFAMILLTTVYAPTLLVNGEGVSAVVLGIVAIHMAVQAGFTVGIHSARSHLGPATVAGEPAAGGLGGAFIVTVFGMIAAFVLGASSGRWFGAFGMDATEIGYRVFLSFYGLVFPAYVWICMLGPDLKNPERRFAQQPSSRALLVCGAAIVLASPLYFAGFIMMREVWLIPGIAIVIGARWLAPRTAAAPELRLAGSG